MKNFSSILNVILLIAVAILFYLHFSSTKSTVQSVNSELVETNEVIQDSLTQFMDLDSNISAKPIKIAYVNNDSLSIHLDMLKDVQAKIQSKSKLLNAKIQGRQKSYERKLKKMVDDYKSAETKLMISLPQLSDAQADEEKEKLMKMGESIGKSQQSAQLELQKMDEEQQRNLMSLQQDEMYKYYIKLRGFCQSFANSLGFDYILLDRNDGSFLFSNANYDVSNYVIDAINKEYAQNKTVSKTDKK